MRTRKERMRMNVKQLFQEVRHSQRELDSLSEQLRRIDTWSKSSTYEIKNVVVQSSVSRNKVEDGAVTMIDLQNLISEMIRSIAYKQWYSNLIIGKISDERYRTVLRCYYLNANSWTVTAAFMHYDPDYIKELGRNALAAAQEASEHLTVSYHNS